jgi:hypothetical protein
VPTLATAPVVAFNTAVSVRSISVLIGDVKALGHQRIAHGGIWRKASLCHHPQNTQAILRPFSVSSGSSFCTCRNQSVACSLIRRKADPTHGLQKPKCLLNTGDNLSNKNPSRGAENAERKN